MIINNKLQKPVTGLTKNLSKRKPKLTGSSTSVTRKSFSGEINQLNLAFDPDSIARKYGNLFYHVSLPYLVIDADSLIIACNPAGEEFLQKSGMALLSTGFKNYVPNENQYLIDNLISRALLSKGKESCETILIVSGKQIPVKISATAVAGSYDCFFEILDLTDRQVIRDLIQKERSYRTLIKKSDPDSPDVTELESTELSLKKSEERYKSLVEFLPIGLVMKNKEGKTVFVNKKSRQILDFDEHVLENGLQQLNLKIKRKDESIMPPEEFPGNIALKEGRVVDNFELGVELEDRNVWLNITAAPVPGREEVILAFMDITEKVIREKQLNDLSKKLKELNATKDKFFSIIAHDLKNPFNILMGYSDLLLKNASSYSKVEVEKFAGIINDTSQKTYNLLENLLIWARSQTGTLEYLPELYNLNSLVESNIQFIGTLACKKYIRVNFQPEGEPFVIVDKNMIDTVLRNILTNAVKFSYPHGDISVSVVEMERDLVVSVKDFGIGIEPENIEKLFHLDSKFSVLGTGNEKGSGLGLMICKEFMDKNYGSIQVLSEYGKGSEFRISIPKAEYNHIRQIS